MFQGVWTIGLENFERVRALRQRVNVELRGVPEKEEFDSLDAFAAHVYVETDGGEPIAAGRMYPDGTTVRIDRIAVMPEFSALPYGELVLRMLLFKAQEMPQNSIAVLAEEGMFQLLPNFGFTRVSEPVAARGGQTALYTCPGNAIIWDSACKHHHEQS